MAIIAETKTGPAEPAEKTIFFTVQPIFEAPERRIRKVSYYRISFSMSNAPPLPPAFSPNQCGLRYPEQQIKECVGPL